MKGDRGPDIDVVRGLVNQFSHHLELELLLGFRYVHITQEHSAQQFSA